MENRRLTTSYRDLLRVALPQIATSASFTILHFCDRMFLAWYSPVALQAAVPAGILFFTMVCGFMALTSFANSFVAQYYGAGEYDKCSRSTAQAIIMALLSCPLILALRPLGFALLAASGHAPEVLAAEKEYMGILMLGGFSVPLSAAAVTFFSGRGKTLTVMAAHLIGNGSNIILNWLLIFGNGGFPEMGLQGAALASVISGFVCPVILMTLYFMPKNNQLFATRRNFRFDASLFWRMLRFGIPSGVHMVLDLASFSFFVLLVGRLGETALIASNIALSVNMIAFLPAMGLGMATGILVGQFQGMGDSASAALVTRKALWLAWGYTLLINLSYLLVPEMYLRLFASGSLPFDEVFPLAYILLFCAALWGVMEATNAVLSGALRGAGDTHFVMWYHTAVAWGLFVTGEVLIILLLDGGAIIAWSWAAVYFSLLAAGFVFRFKSGRWQKIELIERKVPLPERTGGVPAA